MKILINFASLLIVSLVVGTTFGIWLGYAPAALSASAYVEEQQQAIRDLNVSMPILGALGAVLTLALAWLARRNRRALALLVAAAACLIAAGLITRFGNQPINATVITWRLDAIPADWTAYRDEWWRWHAARTSAGLVGLSLLIAGTLVDRR